jgi:zinc protease
LSLVENVTRSQLAAFAKERYIPDHAVLAVAGAVNFEECLRRVQEEFGPWKRGWLELPPTQPPAASVPGLRLVDMDTSVARVHIAALGVNRASPDFELLEIATRILFVPRGAGRLQLAMRESVAEERNPEIPSVVASVTAQRFGGNWRARVTAKLDVTAAAVEGALREIARLRNETVDSTELETAKAGAVSDYIASLEDGQRRLSNYLASWVYKLPSDFWDRRSERLSAITSAQIRSVAQRYLDPKRLVIVVIGPRTKLEKQLKPVGAITVLATDGRVLSQ